MGIDTSGFLDRTIDKVNRLLNLLEELNKHPILRKKLCMYGGTAINLFLLDVPRLSVDIDLAYIGVIDRAQMLVERPSIEAAIVEVATFAGYTVANSREEHAGKTFHLSYMGDWGRDQIKIDMVYLNRSPLVSPESKSCYLRPTLSVLMLSDFDIC